jgi:hypothetical protein
MGFRWDFSFCASLKQRQAFFMAAHCHFVEHLVGVSLASTPASPSRLLPSLLTTPSLPRTPSTKGGASYPVFTSDLTRSHGKGQPEQSTGSPWSHEPMRPTNRRWSDYSSMFHVEPDGFLCEMTDKKGSCLTVSITSKYQQPPWPATSGSIRAKVATIPYLLKENLLKSAPLTKSLLKG